MHSIQKIEVYKELQRELEERKKQLDKPFFEEDFITIEYNSLNNWLYADWKGYQTEGSVKLGCENILQALLQYKCTKVLNDNTNVLGIWTPAAKWVGAEWFPRMEKAGLKYFAWVYSPSKLSQVSTTEAIHHTPDKELVQTFYEIEAAKKWLLSV
jgi:hypothetical protein